MSDPKLVVEQVRIAAGARSIRDLALRFDMAQHDIENAKSGRSTEALNRLLDKARTALKLPPDWPAGDTVALKPSSMAQLRVVGSAAAGDGAEQSVEEYVIDVPSRMVTGVEFGYVIEGTSLMPKITPGTVMVAKPSTMPTYNYVMLVRRRDGSLSAKLVVWENGKTMLRSTDSRPDEEADVEFLGVMTGIYSYSHGVEKAISSMRGLRLEDI